VVRSWVGLWVALLTVPTVAGTFEQWSTGRTLRVDYVHTGTATEEHFALERLRIEGEWPGSRTQTIDTTNRGKYLIELVDLATQRVLYTRGFSSIYGEWETTGEARREIWRALPEALRVPEPRRTAQVRLRKRQTDQSFREVWELIVDPSSRFVDRAPAASADWSVLVDNGPVAIKADLAILGDGYRADQKEKFLADARRASNALFAEEPFRSRKRDFNVRAVWTPAEHAGISRPRAGVFRDSPLGARYNSFDSERYVLTLDDRAWRDAAAIVPYDFVLILVNERKYGGGGIFGLYSTAAVDSGYADYLVVHEFGHHFAGLADEYYTSQVAYEDFAGGHVEPWEPNVTALLDPANLKWRDLVEESTPVPTPWEKDAFEKRSLEYQKKRNEMRAAGAPEEDMDKLFDEIREYFSRTLGGQRYSAKVGAFEGAHYEAQGFYRSTIDCRMFSRDDVELCPVCTRAVEQIIDLYAK